MKTIFMFGSCRIELPLNLLRNSKLIRGGNRMGVSNIYNTSQLLQHINNTLYNITRDEANIINSFFPFNNIKLFNNDHTSNNNNTNNEMLEYKNPNIGLYIIEISSLKSIKYNNICLGVNIESNIKYLFGLDFDDIKNNECPRKITYNIKNILLLSNTGANGEYNLYSISKDILRTNVNNTNNLTNDICYFKDKVNADFFSYLQKLTDIISNCVYEEQEILSFKAHLREICTILKKPILFVPIWNAKDINGSLIQSRININTWINEFVQENPCHRLFTHDEILHKYSYDDIFVKYAAIQKWEIKRLGVYDINHLNINGIKLVADGLLTKII